MPTDKPDLPANVHSCIFLQSGFHSKFAFLTGFSINCPSQKPGVSTNSFCSQRVPMKQIRGLFLSKMTQVGTPIALISTIFLSSCGPIGDLTDKLLFGMVLDSGQRNAGVIVGPGSNDSDFKGYIVPEDPAAGGCVELNLTLRSEPEASVTIPISTAHPAETVLRNASNDIITSITIEIGDYNNTSANIIRICGVPEADVDGQKTTSLIFGTIESDDGKFGGAIPPSVTNIVLLDDDQKRLAVSVSPGGIRTIESGAFTVEGMGRDYFALSLSSAPTGNVVVTFMVDKVRIGSPDERFEGRMLPGAETVARVVTFTTANWHTPQTVTVENLEDYMQDGDQQYTISITSIASADADYACTPTGANDYCSGVVFVSGNPRTVLPHQIAGINLDNYKPAISVAPTSITLDEIHEAPTLINTKTFTVTLNAAPQLGDVDVPFTLPHAGDRINIAVDGGSTTICSIVSGKIRFAASAWTIGTTDKLDCVLRLTAVNNDIHGDSIGPFTLSLSTTTNLPVNMNPDDVNITINDSNWPGILLSELSRSIDETGTNARFCVRLNSKPTGDVTVRINDLYDSKNTSPGNHARFYVVPQSATDNVLTFTTTNWHIPQEITVTPTLNEIWDGSGQFKIGVSDGVSSDPSYNGAPPFANFLEWDAGRINCIANTAIKPTSSNEVIVNHNDNDQGGYVIQAKNQYDGGTSTTNTTSNSPTISGFATDRNGQLIPGDNASWRLKLRSQPRAPVTITFTIPANSPAVFANNNQKTISHTFGPNKTGGNGWDEYSDWISVLGNNDGGATGNTSFTVTTSVSSTDNDQYGYADGSNPAPVVGKPSFLINSCDNYNRDFTRCDRSGTSYSTNVSGGTARIRFIAKANPGAGGTCVPVWSNNPTVAQMENSVGVFNLPPDSPVALAQITSTNWNTLASAGTNSVVVKGVLNSDPGSNVVYQLVKGNNVACGTTTGFTVAIGAQAETITVTNVNNNQPLTVINTGTTQECYGGAAEHTANACTAIPGSAGTFDWGRPNGTSSSFVVKLSVSPTASVTLPISCGNTNCYSLNTTSLTFNTGETEKTVWVASRNIAGINSSGSITVNFGAMTSGDDYFDGITPPSATVASHTDHDKRIWIPASAGPFDGLFAGNFGSGVSQADAYCNNNSYANWPGSGTYSAILAASDRTATTAGCTTGSCSSTGQSNWSLKPNTRYYLHPGGTSLLFTTNAQALFPFGALSNSFGTGGEGHWTGLNTNWTTAANNCDNFTKGTPYESTFGAGAATNNTAISSGSTADCNATKRILCAQQ